MPWNPRVKSALDELLHTRGRESAAYDAANPPAAACPENADSNTSATACGN